MQFQISESAASIKRPKVKNVSASAGFAPLTWTPLGLWPKTPIIGSSSMLVKS